MSKCKGCGGEYRKGTTAALFGQDGSCQPARVCPKCITRGLTIVATFVPPPAPKSGGETRLAEVVKRTKQQLALLARNCKAQAAREPHQGTGSFAVQTGMEAGFLSAIEVLERFAGEG